MKGKAKLAVLAAVLSVGGMTLPGFAQQNPGGGQGQGQNGGGGGGGGRNGGGGNGWQNRRQQMMDNLKQDLGATDDEFTALQPKIEKVMTLQRQLNAGGMRMLFRNRNGGQGGPGGQGGQGGFGNNQDPTPLDQATTALQTTLDNKDAKPEDIKSKLDAFRDAKSKVKDELASAQKDLKDLLTQRQEAVMVEMGMLD